MRQLAHRLDRLGTETAFSVPQAAAAWQAEGNRVHPFHLGGTAMPYRYLPTEDGFAIDLDQVRASITPNTMAIIYNDLQNPISAESTAALQQTGVSFCTREHFGRRRPGEDRQYIRLAYSGIDVADIRDGLGRLRQWIETA